MSMKKLVSEIMTGVRTEIQDQGFKNRPEVAQYVLSQESMDSASREVAANTLSSLHSTIDDTINMVLSKEEFENGNFSKAQFAAAKAIAALAIDPAKTIGAMGNLKAPVVTGAHQTISVESLGIEDVVFADTLSTEAFDAQSTNNAIYYSIAYNFGAARQDAFGEAFFPTVVIDPTISGFNIETEFTSLMSEFDRSITGAADTKKFNKIPIIKAIYDNDLFGNDKNKLVPVYRTENAAMFIATQQFVDKSAGTEITTAPLKLGKTVSLLGISQTDAMLAKGVMDNTDALDRTLNLDKLFFSITGSDGTNTVTDMFKYSVAAFPHSNFTYSTQDHHKDLSLAFKTESIVINTSSTKTAKGAASGILATLPADHTVIVSVRLHGDANTATGDVSVFGSAIEVVEIRDASGDVLPSTSADYVAIKGAFDAIKLEGYTVEAYRTNSNLRTRGQLVTNDRFNQIYNVPLRSGITVLMPTNNATGTDGDAAKLTSMIQAAGIKSSIYAVKTLIEYSEMLHNVTNNGATPNIDLMGIGRHHVNPYYNETTIDLAQYVDSVKSNERIADIRAALVNKIKDEVLNMYVESNYGVAYDVLRGNIGGKVTVVIGTDPKLKQYISGGESKIDLGEDFEAIVVATPNKLVKGKVFVTFGIFDEQRNSTPNPLNFGVCAWAPTISTDIVRTSNGSVVRELQTNPRFLHVVNLPIISVMNVGDTNEVLGKVTKNYHQL